MLTLLIELIPWLFTEDLRNLLVSVMVADGEGSSWLQMFQLHPHKQLLHHWSRGWNPIRLETGASSFCLLQSSRQLGYATEPEQSWQEAPVWNQTEDADHLRGTCSRSRLCFPLRSQSAKTRNFPVTVRWFSKRHLSDFREEHSKWKPSSFSSWKWCVRAASWLLPQLPAST